MRRLSVDEAVAALLAGEAVALPTDTVYGVGASLAHPRAVERLYTIKRRPGHVPLPVICADEDAARSLCPPWPEAAGRLSAALWPGALTLVVRARPEIADLVHGEASRVGLRVPDDDLVRTLVSRVGPIALTSANEHGEPPCTSAEEVERAFEGRDGLAGVLDGGLRDRPVSSVVEVHEGGWRLLREGAVARSTLVEILGS